MTTMVKINVDCVCNDIYRQAPCIKSRYKWDSIAYQNTCTVYVLNKNLFTTKNMANDIHCT